MIHRALAAFVRSFRLGARQGATVAVVALALWPVPAEAQALCSSSLNETRDAFVERYGETTLGLGLSNAGHVLEIWVNPGTRTWTVLSIKPSGVVSLIDSGNDWALPTWPNRSSHLELPQ